MIVHPTVHLLRVSLLPLSRRNLLITPPPLPLFPFPLTETFLRALRRLLSIRYYTVTVMRIPERRTYVDANRDRLSANWSSSLRAHS